VAFHDPATGLLLWSDSVTTDASGNFQQNDIGQGTYNVFIRGLHTLSRRLQVTVQSGTNIINFGTLLEGDANGDNCVNAPDFSILRTAFGQSQGQSGYDLRADFNQDGAVNAPDFSLLRTNFGRCGDIQVTAQSTNDAMVPPTGPPEVERQAETLPVSLSPSLESVTANPGDLITLRLEVDPNSQAVDTVAASIAFDPKYLALVNAEGQLVEEVTPGDTLNTVLQNQVDAAAGSIHFVAGVLSGTPVRQPFTLITLHFKVIAPLSEGETSVRLLSESEHQTGAYFAGQRLDTVLCNSQLSPVGRME
jgi:hypothetical protein